MNTIRNIHNSILNKIESGAIRQKPKWRFVFQMLLFVFGFIALTLIFFYLISFFALVFRERHIFEALSFGPQTVFVMMHKLPLLLVLLVTTIFLILQVLVRHFAFAYMKPVAMTFGAGLALTFVIFIAVLNMDKDSRIARFGQGRHLMPIDMLHARFRNNMQAEVVHGRVESVHEDTYGIRDVGGREHVIYITKETQMSQPAYVVGDNVGILLEKKDGQSYAIAMRKMGVGRGAQLQFLK